MFIDRLIGKQSWLFTNVSKSRLRKQYYQNKEERVRTCISYYRPAEIIEHRKSGFHIDPYHGEKAANLMVEFFEAVHKDEQKWIELSEGALERIYSK